MTLDQTQIYQAACDYLNRIKTDNVNLENYFYGDNKDYQSLKEVFIRFITSAQNYQRMPNVEGTKLKYEMLQYEVIDG